MRPSFIAVTLLALLLWLAAASSPPALAGDLTPCLGNRASASVADLRAGERMSCGFWICFTFLR